MSPTTVAEAAAIKPPPSWTLITSHGLVLLYVARHADATIREIAGRLLITERRVASIIRDLVDVDLLEVRRQGRRNQYKLSSDAKFRHPMLDELDFQSFVELWHD
jgi:DNA-binding MarR family transcriptional regulator